MNETLAALQQAMRARDPVEARRLFTEMEAAGTLTRADLRAGAGLPLRRGEDAGWLLVVLDAEPGGRGDQDDATAAKREALRVALVDGGMDDTAAELVRELVGGHAITPDQLADTFAAALDEIRAGVRLGPCRTGGSRMAPVTTRGLAAATARAVEAVTVSALAAESARYADQAERCLDSSPVSPDARAITAGLLHVGAVIAEAAGRSAEDADAMSAMLAEQLTAIDDSLDTFATVIDPPFIVPPRVPLRWRLAALFRPASASWRETTGGER